MAVKLRLTRIGKKKQPQYRIVAADARSPRDGRFIEILGHYDPRQNPSALTVDNAKAVKWLSQGAQPTERVAKLLEVSGAMAEFKAAEGQQVSSAPTAVAVLTHIVKSIVDHPESVVVDEVENDGKHRLDVRVGPGDLGRVIGRRGRTAASIRTVTRAAASKDGVELDIEFLD